MEYFTETKDLNIGWENTFAKNVEFSCQKTMMV